MLRRPPNSKWPVGVRRWTTIRWAGLLYMVAAVGLGIAFGWFSTAANAQTTSLATASLPEPIYWKQNLFLIPYQWSSGADPNAAHSVWLLVSQDGGANWQKISEAKGHVKAFNYHAAADGEYLFAIRTIDGRGQAWPVGPYQAELRVIVDTTMPRIDELMGELRADGSVAIRWRGSDLNLDPNSWRIEAQFGATSPWQAVALNDPTAGHVVWQPPQSPTGGTPMVLRATVLDRAGNSAVYQAAVDMVGRDALAVRQSPTTWNPTGTGPHENVPDPSSGTSGSPAPQQWPANATARAPFRLVDSGSVLPSDSATTYGRPEIVDTAQASRSHDVSDIDGYSGWMSPGANAAAQGGPVSTSQVEADRYAMVNTTGQPPIRALEPFRQVSPRPASTTTDIAPVDDARPAESRVTTVPSGASPERAATSASAGTGIDDSRGEFPTTRGNVSPVFAKHHLAPGIEPKQVGARTFAVEYQLTDVGHWGVARVELWGTHDGGQTWQRFAEDEDHRSPLYVTVDNAGLYGFRIVVEATGGPTSRVPRAGDEPELWVVVDLDRPQAELVSIQPGVGATSDQLVLRWQAEDANLESRPISLFYSSRASGPWSAIATRLANTGEYVWHVERHVPARVYLRLEARDNAGNLAAFQTAEPIALATAPPGGELQSVTPAGPTATGVESAYW